jgi:hypothetical protein
MMHMPPEKSLETENDFAEQGKLTSKREIPINISSRAQFLS